MHYVGCYIVGCSHNEAVNWWVIKAYGPYLWEMCVVWSLSCLQTV
jgi:hypothetical protein